MVHSLGIRAISAYGNNSASGLDPWHGYIFGGGLAINMNLFRWEWIKLGVAVDALAELYSVTEGVKPHYLAEKGYLHLFSLRLENYIDIYPTKFLYFGLGSIFSLSLTGSLGDEERGVIRTYTPFILPYATFHVGYVHLQPLFGRFHWGVQINGKMALNNETHFELGGLLTLAYQF
ncbi:hypothetical protein P0082_05575 [Candidatus Haliotispira prima]|uniref:Outer membrane protein beta-barrel domain-containing protein n=1 Tax=Candidatus Haliotispira prima TaxID=3034016 RepID=A0ABY8ML41_9SPIO|nr:hypothetical protein P0082_05575 [Candidatus Haliotispira prima]